MIYEKKPEKIREEEEECLQEGHLVKTVLDDMINRYQKYRNDKMYDLNKNERVAVVFHVKESNVKNIISSTFHIRDTISEQRLKDIPWDKMEKEEANDIFVKYKKNMFQFPIRDTDMMGEILNKITDELKMEFKPKFNCFLIFAKNGKKVKYQIFSASKSCPPTTVD